MKKYLIFCLLLLTIACDDDDSIPKGDGGEVVSKGSSYEVLLDYGNCQLFLDAVEKAGFSDLLKGKGLSTIMVPTDSVFSKFLTEKSYGSIDAIELEKLKEIIGIHFLMFSLNKEQLMNFQSKPDEPVLPGAAYKHRTYYAKGIETIQHPILGTDIKVFHREKHLPLFSSNYWKSMGVDDAKRNLQFFYPDMEWRGDTETVNGPGFGIIDYAIPTDNGYIYFIDNVVDGLPTIYDKLKEPDYSITLKLIDRFPNIAYNKTYTQDFATPGDTLHDYLHMDEKLARLQSVAFEWSAVAPILYHQHTSDGITAFIPNDETMESFFNSFFKGYKNYDELPDLTAYYLLQNHQVSPSLLWPETIETGYVTSWGDIFRIQPEDEIGEREICSNGLFYELNRVEEPMIFHRTATRSVFANAGNEIFANILLNSNRLIDVANIDSKLTLFIPSDENLEECYVDYGEKGEIGDEDIYQTKENSDGVEETINITNKSQDIIDYHTLPMLYDEGINLNGRWYETGKPFSYLKIHQDTIYTELGEKFLIEGEEDYSLESNSRAVQVTGIMMPESASFGTKTGSSILSALCEPFREEMIKGSSPSFVDGSGRLKPFIGSKGIVFLLEGSKVTIGKNGIPKNETPAEKKEMTKFVNNYLVSLSDNPDLKLEDLLNGEYTGSLQTLSEGYKLELGTNNEGRLTITPPGATPIVLGEPFFSAETVFYIIDEVILPKP